MAVTAAATCFINEPNFLPRILKLHFTFFTSKLDVPSTKSISLIFTSFIINDFTDSKRSFISASTGIINFCNGCLTIIFIFLRSANPIEDTFCANSMRVSNSLSITVSSQTGKSARWTEATWSRPVVAIKSIYNLSA